jgi:Holliday junction resolvase
VEGVKVVRSYSKGYRVERLAIKYMRRKYGTVCVRSAGSHGACDLLCGNDCGVYAVHVKAGRKKPSVSWEELESFARKFNAKALVLYKPNRKPFVEVKDEEGLVGIRR